MAALSCTLLIALTLCGEFVRAQDQVPLSPSLNAPSSIPALGFGTWKLDNSNVSEAVSTALQVGYRHLDCAAIYGNEKDVGRGIKDGLDKIGLKRSDIWVTSKLWNDHHRPMNVEDGLDHTLEDLGLEYLDLYLMHWPVTKSIISGRSSPEYVATWRAMEQLLDTGKVRHIGVSNFAPEEMRKIINRSNTKPYVHQLELHPYLQQVEWVQWHKDHGIHVTAYSPLANLNPIYGSPGGSKETPPSLLNNKEISDIAEQRNCTNVQVALAWGMGRGTSVIPKSSHAGRIQENINSSECHLEEEDYTTIETIGKKYVKRFNNPSEQWGLPLFEGLDGV